MIHTTTTTTTTLHQQQQNETEEEALSYDQYLSSLRPTQFPQLLQQQQSTLQSTLQSTQQQTSHHQQLPQQQVHLDHAASTLYPNQLIHHCCADLTTHMYANPHSQSYPATRTSQLVQSTRRKLLEMFKTDFYTYSVIFTHNATASCKLIAETFPFHSSTLSTSSSSVSSRFVYMMNNHNSVIGMREIAREKGALIHCIPNNRSKWMKNNAGGGAKDDEDDNEEDEEEEEYIVQSVMSNDDDDDGQSSVDTQLFAFSPECNSTGEKMRTELTGKLHARSMSKMKENTESDSTQRQSVYVLMDVSKYVCSNVLDLSRKENQADFIAFSVYKLFGYPMGLGVLLVKNSSAHILKKSYFGGGTVSFSISDVQKHALRPVLHEAFEDGTIPYLNIIALNHALNIVPDMITDHGRFLKNKNGSKEHFMDLVRKHTFSLAQYAYEQLSSLRHYNGQQVCVFYGRHHTHDSRKQGSIVNFNLRRANGHFVGYGEVSQAATIHSPQINLRTGCFCNPGACQSNLNITSDQVLENYHKGHVCWDGNDLISGEPTGSVRVSFGWMSIRSDVDALISFIREYFVQTEKKESPEEEKVSPQSLSATLTHMIIYPVKSCQGVSVTQWELTDSGPIYDREWTIVDHRGQALQQKLHPKMASIDTDIDLASRTLVLSNSRDPNGGKLTIPLDYYPEERTSEDNLNVCGVQAKGLIYNDPHISEWLSRALDADVHLARKDPKNDRFMIRVCGRECQSTTKINFSNEAQFLLITRSSINDLNERLRKIYWSNESPNKKDYSGCYYANSDWLITRFRPNFVIENAINGKAFEEDNFRNITIDDKLKLNVMGKCNRCSMICVDPIELIKVSEPLKTLFNYRRSEGKVLFGVLLSMENNLSLNEKLSVTIGSRVLCTTK